MGKTKKIVLLIIAIIAIILSFLGGDAYAKYMSKVTGQGSADIATWSFKVNEKQDKMQTISLKSTLNNSSIKNNKIAPGTEGSFQIKIDATEAEVGINYIVKFENETQKPTNLKFLYEGKTYNTLSELQEDLVGSINADDKEKIKTLQIGWNWNYVTGNTERDIEANDMIDTQDGKKITNYTFDVVVTGTQMMPQN